MEVGGILKKLLILISILVFSTFAMAENGDEEVEQAREFFYQKDFKSAEKLYLSAIDKGNIIALNDLGNLYYLKGDYSEAKKYFQKSVDKGGTVALFNLAEVYRIEKNFPQAEKYYLQAIKKGETQAYNNLALLYSESGKLEKAIEYYLKAGESGDVKGYYNLGNLYFYNYEDLKKAEKYYLKAAEQNHQNSIRMLGFVYQGLEDYKKAEIWLSDKPLLESNQFFPLSFKKASDKNYWLLPWEPLINIEAKNIITKRYVAKGGKNHIGSIKERWSTDDYQITITGAFIGDKMRGIAAQTYPRKDMEKLKDYLLTPEALEVKCELLQILGINRIVIESVNFPFTKGENVQAYEIKAVSDFPYQLLYEHKAKGKLEVGKLLKE